MMMMRVGMMVHERRVLKELLLLLLVLVLLLLMLMR